MLALYIKKEERKKTCTIGQGGGGLKSELLANFNVHLFVLIPISHGIFCVVEYQRVQKHQCHRRVDQEYGKRKKSSKTNLNITSSYQYNRLISQYNRLMSLYNRLTETGLQNQQKKTFFARRFLIFFKQKCSNMRPLLSITFPKDSESLKIFDIRLREVGAKRPLNGTSKVNTHTHTQTDRRTDGQTDGQTDRQTDKSTYRLNRPRGRIQ